jgi:hypothetical protein
MQEHRHEEKSTDQPLIHHQWPEKHGFPKGQDKSHH